MSEPTTIIENAIKNNKLSHAYLFYGEVGVDVEYYIFKSIKIILQKLNIDVQVDNIFDFQYADLKIITANNENIIRKETVNQAINELYESNLTKNGIKILYIKDVDLGNRFSLNSLLKFIEEPVKNLIIFMGTNYFDKVISTIKSRTQNVFVKQFTTDEKIKQFSSFCKTDKLNIFANLYNNVNDLKKVDQTLFNDVYDNIINVLDSSLDNPNLLKTKLGQIWTKENNDYVLEILQMFYYQIQTTIDKNHPLFPNHESLIYKYKAKEINYFAIHILIEQVRNNLKRKANFNLQKANFLVELQKEYKKIITD